MIYIIVDAKYVEIEISMNIPLGKILNKVYRKKGGYAKNEFLAYPLLLIESDVIIVF